MPKSHAVAWGEEAPTPAQLKELFTQIEFGVMTRNRLQTLLLSRAVEPGDRIIWFEKERWVSLGNHRSGDLKWDKRQAGFIRTESDFRGLALFLAITYGLCLSSPTAEKCSHGLMWTFVRAGNPTTANLIVKLQLRHHYLETGIPDERVDVIRDERLFLTAETNSEGIAVFDLPPDEYTVFVGRAGKNQTISIKENEPPVRIDFQG